MLLENSRTFKSILFQQEILTIHSKSFQLKPIDLKTFECWMDYELGFYTSEGSNLLSKAIFSFNLKLKFCRQIFIIINIFQSVAKASNSSNQPGSINFGR